VSGKSPPPLKIQVSSLEELVFLTSSTHSSIIHVDEEKKIAFSFLTPIASLRPIIYFCRLEKVPREKFAHANRITGKIRFSNELSTEPNEVNILLVRVRSGELFPSD